MANDMTIPDRGSLPLPQAERMLTSLPPLSGQYPTSSSEADATEQAVEALSRPADPQWIAQRTFTLLSHYFVTDTHPEAMTAVARDWTYELRQYPEWAIDRAAKWWLSRENDKRGKKPMPGDISERVVAEMGAVKMASRQVQFFRKYGDNPPSFVTK